MKNGVGLEKREREIEEKTWRGDQKGKGIMCTKYFL